MQWDIGENMKIKIKKEDYESIIVYARERLPEEACGLIAGTVDGDIKNIEKVYFLNNMDHSREHFTLEPKEQLAAIKDMRSFGYIPLGNWHSHPETPSRPSEEDKRLAFDSNASYLILSLMAEEPVLNSFHIKGDTAQKEELIFV